MASKTRNPRHPTSVPGPPGRGGIDQDQCSETQRVLMRMLGSQAVVMQHDLTQALVTGRGDRLVYMVRKEAVGRVPYQHVERNPELASDLVAEAFSRAIRAIAESVETGEFDPARAPIEHSVRGKTILKLITVLRTSHRVWEQLIADGDSFPELAAPGAPVDVLAIRNPADLQRVLDEVIKRFRTGKRTQAADILTLHFVNDMTRADIVELRGYTPHQVRYVFRRLRVIGRALAAQEQDNDEKSALRALVETLRG